jgi:nitrate/nitrite-specific signal transduction histidine kinase
MYLVDGNGLIVYHPDNSRIGDDFSDQIAVQKLLAGESGAARTRDITGENIVAGYAPVPGMTWGLVTEEKWSTLLSGSQSYQQYLWILIILGVLVPIGFVIVGVRRITRPIDDLIIAAQQVALGNFDQSINADTGDEIEELAEQFNKMASELHESYTQLEQRVADRTQELEALYQADEELYRHLNLNQVLQALMDVSVDILHADKSAIMVWDEGSSRLVHQASRGFSQETINQLIFAKNEGLIGTVVQTGESAIIEDTWANPYITSRITEPEGIRSFMHVPIKIKGRIFGVFNVNYLKPRAFGGIEQRLFTALAQRASLAIENAQLYEQAQLVAAVEERQRLARELHDAVTQSLFSASLIAEVLTRLWEKNPEEGRRRLDELRNLTRGALAEMRTLLLELRPAALMEAEVQELFRHLCDAFSGRALIPVEYSIETGCPMPDDIKVAYYRIAQETLNNVAKHAQATQVKLKLCCLEDQVLMEIEDDGRGFDPSDVPPDHLGLGIMRERADQIGAEMSLSTVFGHGTKVTVSWHKDGAGE